MKSKRTRQLLSARIRRISRVRATVRGTTDRPRLAVRRSARHFSAQLIDDRTGRTLCAVHDRELKSKERPLHTARALGTLLAKKAQERKIQRAVFDRRQYQYHGRVRAFAEGVREAGLTI